MCVRRVCIDIRSDFGTGGCLIPKNSNERGEWQMWGRRLFPAARRRIARWLHLEMENGLSGDQMLDSTFIGRRGHACEGGARLRRSQSLVW